MSPHQRLLNELGNNGDRQAGRSVSSGSCIGDIRISGVGAGRLPRYEMIGLLHIISSILSYCQINKLTCWSILFMSCQCRKVALSTFEDSCSIIIWAQARDSAGDWNYRHFSSNAETRGGFLRHFMFRSNPVKNDIRGQDAAFPCNISFLASCKRILFLTTKE